MFVLVVCLDYALFVLFDLVLFCLVVLVYFSFSWYFVVFVLSVV